MPDTTDIARDAMLDLLFRVRADSLVLAREVRA